MKRDRTYQALNLKIVLLSFWLFTPLCGFGQLILGQGYSAGVLVRNILVGDGVETNNISHIGSSQAIGLFENADSTGLGLGEGIILSTGPVDHVKGPNIMEDQGNKNKGGDLQQAGYKTLEDIVNFRTFDASVLQFDFKPKTESIEFTYVFASDEYIEFVDKNVNDIFGFYISGPGITGEQNVAKIPGTSVEVSIDNVNHKRNTAYFIQNNVPNSNLKKYLQQDGQTVVLKAKLSLIACQWYTIKLAIADVGDPYFDSWVFIGSKSFKHKTLIGDDTTFCSNGFVRTLDAGYPNRDVLWSTGERTQTIQVKDYGTYTVEVFTECGSFKDEVHILPAIRPISIGNDTAICGTGVNLKLEVKNRVFQHYQWSTGDTTPTITANQPGEYWLEVERDGCMTRDTINISEVNPPQFNLGNDTLVCGDLDMVLSPRIFADSFLWNDGSDHMTKRITTPGLYWLEAYDADCGFRDSINIQNRQQIEVDLGPDTITYCTKRSLRLTTQINDTTTYDIEWTTGEKVGAIEVDKPGYYAVRVLDKLCDFVARDAATVVFLDEAIDYYVPNAFSPSQDGLNETFGTTYGLTSIDYYALDVYDRWGSLVFHTNNIHEKWDGTVAGKPAPVGVYMWHSTLEAGCLDDHKRFQSGTVTIVR